MNEASMVLEVIDYRTRKELPAVAKDVARTSLVAPGDQGRCNPAFNKTNTWQNPRQVRLGVRLTL